MHEAETMRSNRMLFQRRAFSLSIESSKIISNKRVLFLVYFVIRYNKQ